MNIKFAALTGAVALLMSGSALPQTRSEVFPGRDGYRQVVRGPVYFSRGDRVPPRYRDNEYKVRDIRGNNLPRPNTRASFWVRVNNQFLYIDARNGIVREVIKIEDRRDKDWGNDWRHPTREFPDRGPPPRIHDRSDQEARWRERYRVQYSADSDPFYRECRNKVDPAAAIVGAVLGGLLGNAAGGRGSNQTGATIAGVFAGGAIGAALSSNLDCEDRVYAYQTYGDGFNAGRENAKYEWRNPKSGRRGELLVRDYYDDPDGFRCADFSQTIYIDGRPREGKGKACRQPDGSWAIVG